MSELRSKFVIRKRESYVPRDHELKHMITFVEGKKKSKAFAKDGFEFCHYQDKTFYGELVSFCAPYEVLKTKKFKHTGIVNFLAPKGSRKISLMDYVVKVDEMNFLVLEEQAFHALFSIQ